MMPSYIEKYRWVAFNAQKSPTKYLRLRFEGWGGGHDRRITIRMFGKEFIYSAVWSKYPPETEPVYEPLKDASREVAKYLRRRRNRRRA